MSQPRHAPRRRRWWFNYRPGRGPVVRALTHVLGEPRDASHSLPRRLACRLGRHNRTCHGNPACQAARAVLPALRAGGVLWAVEDYAWTAEEAAQALHVLNRHPDTGRLLAVEVDRAARRHSYPQRWGLGSNATEGDQPPGG